MNKAQQGMSNQLTEAKPVRDDESGVTYEPWTNGSAVGFRCEHDDGRVEFIYLNPSTSSGDGVPNVFVYIGWTGDPATDLPEHHYELEVLEESK